MRKTDSIILLVTIVVIILIIGVSAVAFMPEESPPAFVVQQPTAAPAISNQQAIAIASQVTSGDLMSIERVQLNGRDVLTVEVENNDEETEVFIDAQTGDIIKVERETDVGREQIQLIEAVVTQAQARAIAAAATNGRVSEVEIERVNGEYVYEVEVQKDSTEIEVIIDMQTGAVLDIEQKVIEEIVSTGSVSRDEAIEIAREYADGSFDEIERASYQGRDVFVVDFEDGNDETEVTVDMETGEVLRVATEDD